LLKHFKLIIEYDGADLHGWQIQKSDRTVQGDLERILRRLCPEETISLIGSGRTDSGVHAKGQVASLSLDTKLDPVALKNALNANLQDDIRIQDCSLTDRGFHARYSATRRTYSYHIVREYSVFTRKCAWWVKYPLDLKILQTCAEIVQGEHDFSRFCKATAEVNNKICDVAESYWTEEKGHLYYTISANRFLQHMVRYLVGTMIEVGRGRYGTKGFTGMINNTCSEMTVVRAPAQGLTLLEVDYSSGGMGN